MRCTLGLLTLVLLGLATSSAIADVFVPAGLNPGDEYHLVFVTDGDIDGISADINVYNDFVQTQAAMNPTLTGTDMGVTYAAIASTPTVDARDNALVGAPVFLLNGAMVSTGFSDMWDGSIGVGITISQSEATFDFLRVWTGSSSNGLGSNPRELGGADVFLVLGFATSTDSAWISNSASNKVNDFPMYALSEKLTVAAVPEPTSILALIGLGVVGLSRRRSCSI